ncbi:MULTISPECIES: hypothetical protein [unclassified Streptomyces]|uniref:hypothetical protein n=1 Tax=unclassified Streptomyces TaxID=2593676 RepID=UPI002DDBA3D0|nr:MULTISPECIES: hypothetical protein [unclassified Streptomyces]WSB76116.1 hypothetical protein OHB04_10170 [Streptomyces sp. NBC_01775]WSS15610.1 hypothetical protein OG533_29755 [Streptomyces sp. NBC_01186]WSS44451.1 hypothetical protein OG220_30555 [Streptomyces sp. NBC_01187]
MPKKKGYPRSVLVGTATLLCETMVVLLISTYASYAMEHPGGTGGGSALAFLLLPPLALVCLVVTVCLALPALAVAEVVRRESWQGVLLCAAGIAFVPCLLMAGWLGFDFLGSGFLGFEFWGVDSLGFLATWLVGTLMLGTTALEGRRARQQRARRGAWRALGRTLGLGALACVLTVALGYGAFATEIVTPYAPPRVTAGQLYGTWSDGKFGTLRLTPDGSAMAGSLSLPGGDFGDETESCSGTGGWDFNRASDPWEQSVTVTMEGCEADQEWFVLGSAEHPKLYLSEGDPDSPEITTLTKR